MKMICENAERCKNDYCNHRHEHEKDYQCGEECNGRHAGILGSKCVPYPRPLIYCKSEKEQEDSIKKFGDDAREMINNTIEYVDKIFNKKEKDMTILEKLEDLKIFQNTMTINEEAFYISAIDDCIQIVKESLPTEEEYNKKCREMTIGNMSILILKEYGLLQPSPKRYKWTNDLMITENAYTEKEFIATFEITNRIGHIEEWHKVKEEV